MWITYRFRSLNESTGQKNSILQGFLFEKSEMIKLQQICFHFVPVLSSHGTQLAMNMMMIL